MVMPAGTLVLFCKAGLSHLVEGIPPVNTLVLPMVFRAGPIIIPDATPPATPALSPMLVGIVVPILCAGIMEIKCLSDVVGGRAIGSIAVFG
jgi:hypothetical protein